jgi:hypothetical protein
LGQVKLLNERDGRRFTRARAADKGQRLAGLDTETEVAQNWSVGPRRVRERHVPELNGTLDGRHHGDRLQFGEFALVEKLEQVVDADSAVFGLGGIRGQ